jgi:hypothetical protein
MHAILKAVLRKLFPPESFLYTYSQHDRRPNMNENIRKIWDERRAPTKDCDVHPDGCQGYVYHTGRRSDVPKEERRYV